MSRKYFYLTSQINTNEVHSGSIWFKSAQLLNGGPWKANDAQLPVKTPESLLLFKKSHVQRSGRTTALVRMDSVEASWDYLDTGQGSGHVTGARLRDWLIGWCDTRRWYLSIHECLVSRREQAGHGFNKRMDSRWESTQLMVFQYAHSCKIAETRTIFPRVGMDGDLSIFVHLFSLRRMDSEQVCIDSCRDKIDSEGF